ncbi:hypothetical protein [Galbibacter sp. PAP.153]|uniref:hypothetical protein n=1 Tax=Galbibacter sp. PAP.153 TaxID=3104623 RepID=UPI00300985DE
MRTNQPKWLNGLLLGLCVVFLASCNKGGNLVEYNPVDLSQHKLTPKLAEKLSKRYVKDMDELFAQSDSLEYYKALVKQLQEQQANTGSGRSIKQSEPVTFKPKKPKFELSVSSWYSVDELMTYIDNSMETVEKSGGKVDGFRIYIGVFPKVGDDRKKNTLTTFITPTGHMGSGKEEGSVLPNLAIPLYAAQDITGVDPLDYSGTGEPPSRTYPQ